jgi:hypothetical protein
MMKWVLLVFLVSPSEDYISSVAIPFEKQSECISVMSRIEEHNMDGHFQEALCVTREHFEGIEPMDEIPLD